MNIAVVISVGLCVARKHGNFTIYPWQMILWVKSLLHEMIDELVSYFMLEVYNFENFDNIKKSFSYKDRQSRNLS